VNSGFISTEIKVDTIEESPEDGEMMLEIIRRKSTNKLSTEIEELKSSYR